MNTKIKYSHLIASRTKFLFHLFPFPLLVFLVPYVPIHILSPEDLKWKYWTSLMGILTLKYPSSDDWKIEIIKDKNSTYLSDKILLTHTDQNFSNVKISFSMISIDEIDGKSGYPLLESYSSYANALVEQFEFDKKNKEPNFKVVEKHSGKYLIDGSPASSILSRHSSSLGNTSGMLTVYAIEEKNELLLTYRYIFNANDYMGYLSIAEEILNSIRIQDWTN